MHDVAIGHEICAGGWQENLGLHGGGGGLELARSRECPRSHCARRIEQREHGSFMHTATFVCVVFGEGQQDARLRVAHMLDMDAESAHEGRARDMESHGTRIARGVFSDHGRKVWLGRPEATTYR